MTLLIPNNFGNATYVWHSNAVGRDVSITLGFKDNALAGDPFAASAALRGFATSAGSIAEAPAMINQWLFLGVRVLLRNNLGQLLAGQTLVTTTGSVAAPTGPAPIFAPWVVTKATALAGRQYRGRMYLPMTLEDESSTDVGGSINTTIITNKQSRVSQWIVNMSPSGYPPYLLHSNQTVPPLPTLINGMYVRPVVGMQRRRRTRGA